MLGTRISETPPNKNVMQGMDFVYSQTKSGRPDVNVGKLNYPKRKHVSPKPLEKGIQKGFGSHLNADLRIRIRDLRIRIRTLAFTP